MLARLILALLLAAFAMPAAAAGGCHDGAPAHHAMPGMPDMPDHKAVAAHICIGCIPPGNWRSARMTAPVGLAGMTPPARIARLDIGGGTPPALPPPRKA